LRLCRRGDLGGIGIKDGSVIGRELVEWFFMLTAAAYNLIRIPKILAAAG
jgi:hypothetical protein